MSEEKLIIGPSSAETITDHEFSEQANLITDYACMLEEKVQLEKKLVVLEFTNHDSVSRLKETERTLDDTKCQLRLNEEVVETLRTQLEMNRQALTTEQQVYKTVREHHEAMIADLRDDLKTLRKKLCLTTAELDKAQGMVDYLKQRCVEYKDKLRGFAILFTYFNDPKRSRSEQFLSASDSLASRSQSSLATSKSASNLSSVKQSDQGVQPCGDR